MTHEDAKESYRLSVERMAEFISKNAPLSIIAREAIILAERASILMGKKIYLSPESMNDLLGCLEVFGTEAIVEANKRVLEQVELEKKMCGSCQNVDCERRLDEAEGVPCVCQCHP